MLLSQPRVGILRGGPSKEYDVSLKTGSMVLRALPEQFRPFDIFISKEGDWHLHGVPRQPAHILGNLDIVFNAMHGEYGEDGQVQQILEHHRIPYTGSGPLGSAASMNKSLAKKIFHMHGLQTPAWKVLRKDDFGPRMVPDIFASFSQPSIVKPIGSGSSVGVRIISSEQDLFDAVTSIFDSGSDAILEELILGREASCGVIDGFRKEREYVLPPVEIVPPADRFFDFDAKYSGVSEEICPGRFDQREKEAIQSAARLAHTALGLRHYSRSDFMIHPTRGVFILETNSLPGLTEESLFTKSLAAVGSGLPEFVEHVLVTILEG